MAHHLKPFQLHGFLRSDPGLSPGYTDLFLNRIHTFQIWQQQPLPPAISDNDTMLFSIQLLFAVHCARLCQHIHTVYTVSYTHLDVYKRQGLDL